MRGLVDHPSWTPAFEVSAKLATLTARMGAPCRVEPSGNPGEFVVRCGEEWHGDMPLAVGATQLDAVEAALKLAAADTAKDSAP